MLGEYSFEEQREDEEQGYYHHYEVAHHFAVFATRVPHKRHPFETPPKERGRRLKQTALLRIRKRETEQVSHSINVIQHRGAHTCTCTVELSTLVTYKIQALMHPMYVCMCSLT